MSGQDNAAGARGLANLLLLQDRIRDADSRAALGAVVVNDTRIIVPYDIAVCWQGERGRGDVLAVSNLPEPERQSAFTLWSKKLCAHLSRARHDHPVRVEVDDIDKSLQVDWPHYLPAHSLWLPLRAPGGHDLGGMVLSRPKPWQDEELRVLERLAKSTAFSLEFLMRRRRRRNLLRNRKRFLLAGVGIAAIAAAMFIQVPLTILVPAEVVPLDPYVVRAPLRGVVETVDVEANQAVKAGDSLVHMDSTQLQTDLAVARQEYEIAIAEYRRAQQAASSDRESSSQMQVLLSRVHQKNAELEYITGQLDRADIKAPQDGIVILPGRTEMEGLPVSQGERLMVLADPKSVEMELWLPVNDRIPLHDNNRVTLFLNVEPDHPYDAKMHLVDFQAKNSPAGVLSFRARSSFVGADRPRVGLRGVAKIYGDDVPLYVMLFRRPWAALRPWLEL
ncbi:efflux RND transporter periplasmic adaptor subunit [Thalassospira marina]|uniref:CzcB-like barrel-sandwich hybrid domain-containing protein n=1 Tax=Thalassospira marina TaxID=2048283 RepID=A0A2N3KT09_9PROT|nr:HlyD family efflux transporter periplasmic adaptor subunit [Thalassospira marina]AUG54819.1 hypothetical protein CSC3H3_20410 [Thalassospira marina]PKR53681.1 hypothetical protein COO20_14245 [Thalassospira marina]